MYKQHTYDHHYTKHIGKP